MAALSQTTFLDDLYTTTWQNRVGGISDNIFSASPFWAWLKKNGRLKPVRGGRAIEMGIEYAKNSNVKWLGRGGTTSLNSYEFLSVASFKWKYLVASMVRFAADDQMNSGKAKIIDRVNSTIDNTRNSIIETLESQLSSGYDVTGEAIDGLQALVADDPTAAAPAGASALGGIDSSQAQFAYWRNKTSDFTGLSFAAKGLDYMRTMVGDVTKNRLQDRPDIILSDQTSYEYYEDLAFGQYRIQSRALADLGFDHSSYKGIPMVWSPAISNRMYFLNTKFLNFVYDPAMFLTMTEWKPIPNQLDRAAQIALACQFTTNRRMVQGVIHNIALA